MNLPEEFKGRVVKTNISAFKSYARGPISEKLKEWPGSEVDVIYENGEAIVVAVFETSEDALAFTFRYGEEFI